MKINFLIIAFLFLANSFVKGQTYAFIDSDYIMENVPEYKEAKEKLDKMADAWTKELEERFAVIKTQKDNYNKEEMLEKETIELQTQRFGLNGDYFIKRQELIKPIQDRIYTAMKKVAKSDGYTFVFDKSNQSNLIYADKEADISNLVLEEMGIDQD
jgi:outer membrane protein